MNVNKINQQNNYNTGRPKVKTEYSSLNIPSTHQGTGNMGYIIPHVFEMLPSQKSKFTCQIGMQFNPFVTNLFHQINGELMAFFCPNRLIWDDWETFITGGLDGEDSTAHPTIDLADLYTNTANAYGTYTGGIAGCLTHTLADYFGMPIDCDFGHGSYDGVIQPTDFPWRAYNKIYNDNIRFPDILDTEVDPNYNDVQKAYWPHNYFTRSRIYQQRGAIPSIPVSDELEELAHEFTFSSATSPWSGNSGSDYGLLTDASSGRYLRGDNSYDEVVASASSVTNPVNYMRVEDHELSALGMNMNDFMTGLGIMRYQVNNAKIQPRYVEQLQARWGVYNLDMRLDRPEYIGSKYFNVGTNGVTQTSYGDTGSGETPQGYITGQAFGAGDGLTFDYECEEHGYLFIMMIIRPEACYTGGLSRRWIKETKFDYATPELANLPDREVFTYELMYEGQEANDTVVFGWQGIYEEYRTLVNEVHGLLRPTTSGGLPSYTLAQYWEPGTPPVLNNDFMSCTPDTARILQYTDQPEFIYYMRINQNTAIPLPVQSSPGDLNYL